MAQTRIEKKITVKTVMGGKPSIEKIIAANKEGKALALFEIYGIANSTKDGKTVAPDGNVSEWVKLLGSFMARNIETGEVVRAGEAILPGAANSMIAGALGNPDARGVEFGFRISAKYDEKAATNYIYHVEALHAIQENDPLEKLAAKINTPQLSAPAPVSGNGEKPTLTKPAEPARPAARR